MSHHKHKEHKHLLKKFLHKMEGKLFGKKGAGVILHALNKVNPAIITLRGAMLGVIDLNVVGIASAYKLVEESKNKEHWNEMLNKWWLMGGEKKLFAKAVNKHYQKKHLFEDLFDKKHGHHYEFEQAFEHAESNPGKAIAKAGVAITTVGGLIAAAGGENPAGGEVQDAIGGYVGLAGGLITALGASMAKSAKEQGATDKDLKDIKITPFNPEPKTLPKDLLPAHLAEVHHAIDEAHDEDIDHSDRLVEKEHKIKEGTYTDSDKVKDKILDDQEHKRIADVSHHSFIDSIFEFFGKKD